MRLPTQPVCSTLTGQPPSPPVPNPVNGDTFGTVSNSEFIDHQLATHPLLGSYVSDSTQVFVPSYIADYKNTTTDHYPVLSRFSFQASDAP